MVETERRRVADVLRILPVRHGLREDGRLDVSAALRVATKAFDLFDRLEGERAENGRPPGAGKLIALRASVFRRGVAFEP